jgi:hypothetical protein
MTTAVDDLMLADQQPGTKYLVTNRSFFYNLAAEQQECIR